MDSTHQFIRGSKLKKKLSINTHLPLMIRQPLVQI